MSERKRGVRAWYGRRTPPDENVIFAAEEAEGTPSVLYDHVTHEGEYAEIVNRIYNEMDSLKRHPAEFRTWTVEDGMATYFQAILDIAPTDMRSRVAILQRFGVFKFRAADGPNEKKAKIEAIFLESDEEEDYEAILRVQAKTLIDLWSPNENTLLDYIVNQPAQVGRMLADRLSPTNETPFQIIGHPFQDVRSTDLVDLAESKTVAYERDSAIHLVTDVREVLENWDVDAEGAGGCEQFSLLDALLLHEVVELWLREDDPEIDILDAHIIATTFERYLKGTLLNVAVEDFFLDWPQPSAQEVAEQQKAEMEEQQKAFAAFMDDDDAPDNLDDDVDDLPMDSDGILPKKKKKVAKAPKEEIKPDKSKEGKLFRTKDGQYYRIVDGKKVRVKKKTE
ncbi:MAG TPA: hypothetical protein EYQ18_06775 [Candidatus Handelsmanbacteria bacterium]|nr:hypothetical protein [Candidatus Handelsmanbacteria bacterium]